MGALYRLSYCGLCMIGSYVVIISCFSSCFDFSHDFGIVIINYNSHIFTMQYNKIHIQQPVILFTQRSMAIIYILFWWLKLIGGSPAEELIIKSITFVDFNWFYPLLGIWEVWIGLLFLNLKRFKKFWFWLFIGHMIGTFIPFITTPELCTTTCTSSIQFAFTIVWQYIIKNLALISCWLVLKYHTHQESI